MIQIDATNIALFAINTGELYEAHKQLAREDAPVRSAGIAKSWLGHVSGPVLTLYTKQIEPCWATLTARLSAAEHLKDYYDRHLQEMSA